MTPRPSHAPDPPPRAATPARAGAGPAAPPRKGLVAPSRAGVAAPRGDLAAPPRTGLAASERVGLTAATRADFALGRGREGTPDAIRALGVAVETVPLVHEVGRRGKISSSALRARLAVAHAA
jgi:hypothetical protein